ncbi:hypothetical protein ARAM_001115 [Aspergillus rambellii]|uniref:Ecp2 effector protein domain-containing protein n=1 Tax=Aspergillus rambellii TaxID=308745 RepID=A0A0F8ULI7_9EURO|nr:hypothetical protein ARAM_001115 [Aspergillus rambellii]
MHPRIALLSIVLLPVTLGAAVPFEKRGLFIPSWEVEVTPGGETVVLNGTIEEVHDELIKLNPKWDEDFPVKKRDLPKRTDFSSSDYSCQGRWEACSSSYIYQGIEYLRKVKGRPGNGAGPGNCGRDSKGKLLESFGSIADGAEKILDKCTYGAMLQWTSGQVFHETNWNVIVRKDDC